MCLFKKILYPNLYQRTKSFKNLAQNSSPLQKQERVLPNWTAPDYCIPYYQVLDNVNPGDRGLYKCRVDFRYRERINSAVTTITVLLISIMIVIVIVYMVTIILIENTQPVNSNNLASKYGPRALFSSFHLLVHSGSCRRLDKIFYFRIIYYIIFLVSGNWQLTPDTRPMTHDFFEIYIHIKWFVVSRMQKFSWTLWFSDKK